MYSNALTSISGLGSLVRLEMLWLHGNKFETVEGLGNLTNLTNLKVSFPNFVFVEIVVDLELIRFHFQINANLLPAEFGGKVKQSTFRLLFSD